MLKQLLGNICKKYRFFKTIGFWYCLFQRVYMLHTSSSVELRDRLFTKQTFECTPSMFDLWRIPKWRLRGSLVLEIDISTSCLTSRTLPLRHVPFKERADAAASCVLKLSMANPRLRPEVVTLTWLSIGLNSRKCCSRSLSRTSQSRFPTKSLL